MAIYMFIPGISGSTTAQGYNQWIPLSSIDCGVGRAINTVPGRVTDRIRSTAIGTEMEIIKSLIKVHHYYSVKLRRACYLRGKN